VKLLETLRPNRPDDRQFAEDKSTVIGKLQVLEAPQKSVPANGGPVQASASSGTTAESLTDGGGAA